MWATAATFATFETPNNVSAWINLNKIYTKNLNSTCTPQNVLAESAAYTDLIDIYKWLSFRKIAKEIFGISRVRMTNRHPGMQRGRR